MKVLHLINKINRKTNRRLGMFPVKGKKNRYSSCCWFFSLDKSKKFIGGMVFFHDTKKDSSFTGGIVKNVFPVDLRDSDKDPYIEKIEGKLPKRLDRVRLEFEEKPDGQGQKWRGPNYSRCWNSGIIEIP